MDSAIIASLITAIATLSAVYFAHRLQKRRQSASASETQSANDQNNQSISDQNQKNHNPLLPSGLTYIASLKIYAISTTNAVSAFEVYDNNITVDTCTVLIRLLDEDHPLYTPDYQTEINSRVSRWKAMVQQGRIKHLKIIGCPNIPDVCYSICDATSARLFINRIDLDDPCNQAVDKAPLCFDAEDGGAEMIARLNWQFDSYVEHYSNHGTVIVDE